MDEVSNSLGQYCIGCETYIYFVRTLTGYRVLVITLETIIVTMANIHGPESFNFINGYFNLYKSEL